MTGEPTEIPTNPEIVAVEHPEPEIISSTVPPEGSTPEPDPDQAADEDEDRQAGIRAKIAEKVEPVPGQLTIEPEA